MLEQLRKREKQGDTGQLEVRVRRRGREKEKDGD